MYQDLAVYSISRSDLGFSRKLEFANGMSDYPITAEKKKRQVHPPSATAVFF